ncbi:Adenylosuccinate synthetase [Trichinella spiralis]|uniref:Adenylosuccinate synthetase n=1 Tax=Trichinella spiralis TaxID=6334 RepID=A0ABR3KTI0_TRISP
MALPIKVESLNSIFGKSILICNTFGNTQTVVCIHFRFLDPEINFGANLRVSCGWSTTAAGVTREPPLPIPSSMVHIRQLKLHHTKQTSRRLSHLPFFSHSSNTANKQPANFVQLELLWLLLLLFLANLIVVVNRLLNPLRASSLSTLFAFLLLLLSIAFGVT